MNIIKIKDNPQCILVVAEWFHSKWGVPMNAYIESMKEALESKNGVPMWYYVEDNNNNIIAGLGVIENDFHKRPDLRPNICAVYVEEPYRKQGLAKAMLDKACMDLNKCGINDVYLITTHTNFYEKCGWEFYDMIEENDGDMVRMYYKHTK